MAQSISVNIYAINGQTFRTKLSETMAFPVDNSVFRAVDGTVFAGDGTTRLYGIVQPLPTGLNVSQPQFYTIETVAQLVALANA